MCQIVHRTFWCSHKISELLACASIPKEGYEECVNYDAIDTEFPRLMESRCPQCLAIIDAKARQEAKERAKEERAKRRREIAETGCLGGWLWWW